MNSNIKRLVLFAAMLAAAPMSWAVPPIPNGSIIASASPANATVGQTVTVTCRMSGYDGTAEIDSVNFNVSYDAARLAFVDGSFNIGGSSGPDQQWLSKTNQESATDGFQLVNYSDGSFPGVVFVTLGDLGPSNPERGTLAPAGFLLSFQFQVIAPGSTTISLRPALDGSVLLNTSLQRHGEVSLNSLTLFGTNTTLVSVVASDATASEPGTNTASFEFRRTGPTNSYLAVQFNVEGTAREGFDYFDTGHVIVIPAGSSNAVLLIEPINDDEPEDSESVKVVLLSTPDYGLSSSNTATAVIHDDDNQPPVVMLTSPSNGGIFFAPTNLILSATASDADGSVTKVEFFSNGSTKIGEDASSPYSITWTNVTPGPHVLTARGTDNFGITGDSLPVTVVIRGAPAVSITAPTNGATFYPPSAVPISVSASDPDGIVTVLELFQNGVLLAATNKPALSWSWNAPTATNHTLTARATDDRGLMTTSAPVSIVVGGAQFQDNFSNRFVIFAATNYVAGSNSGYSKETGEASHAGRNGTRSAWIAWKAAKSGMCFIDTEGSGFDTVLAVYTNTPSLPEAVSNLVVVTFNDDASGAVTWSKVSFQATANRTYQIAVDGYAANVGGEMVLHLAQTNTLLRILTQPQSAQATVGDSVTFSVTAAGPIAAFFYSWLYKATNQVLYGPTNCLTLTNVQVSHSGTYLVVVNDTAGNSITSAPAALVVREMPTITNGPATQVVNVGSNATFSVVNTGTAPMNYQWKSNGVPIPGAITNSYIHYNAQHSDTGIFSATVENAVGSTSASAELIVRPRFSSVSLSNTALTLFWNGTPSRAYAIEGRSGLETSAPTWSALATVTNAAVPAQWSLPATNLPGQFLRMRQVE